MEIAFAGRSNVGKSTLINKIFQRKSLARVSAVPGKTATINFYRLDPLTIVDLPGYGYAKVAKSEKERWSGLISGYLGADRDLRLILLLIDMRHAPSKDDLQMIDFLVESELPFLIVLTKADKLNKTERTKRMQAFETEIPYFSQIHVIPFSAVTREGVAEVQGVLEEIASETEE
jgi:GTP-binding protein